MSEGRDQLIASERNPADGGESLWTQFTQQRLKAWQPILEPQCAIALYAVGGLLFLGIGVVLLMMSQSVEEYSRDYTDLVLNDQNVGSITIEIEKDMEPPIWIYYELEGFHQNHRRYVKSRDDDQLQASRGLKLTPDQLPSCRPWVAGDDGRVRYPCGLVARSVFNDTFAIQVKDPDKGDDSWELLQVDNSAKTIAWAADIDKFVNLSPHEKHEEIEYQALMDMWIVHRFPPAACKQEKIDAENPFVPAYPKMKQVKVEEGMADNAKGIRAGTFDAPECQGYGKDETPSCSWVDHKNQPLSCEGAYKEVPVPDWGVESGQFIVWMRVAGLPTFRKLWGKVDRPLKAGSVLKVHIASHFPVKQFRGAKALVVSTSSALGGRNDFLGIGYLVVGVACLGFGTWFLGRHLRNPRGDSPERE